jgi:gas vesicle structural protein
MFDSIHCSVYGLPVVVAERICGIISTIEGERQPLCWFPRSSQFAGAAPPPPRYWRVQAVERVSSGGYLDILDRVLDKGIVIDAWMRVGLVGIDLHLVEIESRIVVASIETYLTYAPALTGFRLVSPPRKLASPKRNPAA